MPSDWDEIKRLAADFQKAQLTSTLQKLSEHNCVEIVTLLLEKHLIEAVFTTDGKEYITPQHLEREIQDELYVNGGRVNLVEVSKALLVDLTKIQPIADNIVARNQNIHLVLGQLIDEDYITQIAQEINEKLSQKGEITITELAQQYDLPPDFLLHDVVEKHLGKIIRGRQDPSNPRNIFTQAFIQHCKSKIRGALSAITRPTNVSTILQLIGVQDKIFHSLFDEIAPAGQLTSKLLNAQYIPHIYSKIQTDWVTSFYKQNHFLEYDTIMKLGISEPKQFIRKQFPNEDIMYLKRCAIDSKIIELTVITALNECLSSKSYVDLSTILPSNMSAEDIEEIYQNILTQNLLTASSFHYIDSVVFSQQYLNDLMQPCFELARVTAKNSIDNGIFQQYIAEKQLANKSNSVQDFDDEKFDKREERRRKAASGKAGGGSQGRETKTKSTKKHQRGKANINRDSDDDDSTTNASNKKATSKILEFVKIADILKLIHKQMEEEGLEHLNSIIAELYHSQLNTVAHATAQELYAATPQTNRRETHAFVQEKINTLLNDIRLYEKGLKLFNGDIQVQLTKYLLKSLGNDICNEITVYIGNECNITLKSTTFNIEQRNKIAQDCDSHYKTVILELNKTLNKTIEEFEEAVNAALKECSMIIKKIDKKKDRQLIIQHKEKLLEQLYQTSDSALILHLTSLILFTTITGNILHASGKFVSQILSYIRVSMTTEQNDLLMQYHDLVLKILQSIAESIEAKLANEELNNLQPKLLALATNYEKPGVTKTD